jgi:gluconokinase
MARTSTIVVMGVAGSGKSAVMAALVERFGWAHAEADHFHPAANVEKMAAGQPLTDADRRPWLEALAAWIGETELAGHDAILTCSALRRAYRDLLRQGRPSLWFAHLVAPRELLAERIERRTGHYMPLSLLQSQLDTLEPLAPDEPGAEIDASGTVEATVARILAARPQPDRPTLL